MPVLPIFRQNLGMYTIMDNSTSWSYFPVRKRSASTLHLPTVRALLCSGVMEKQCTDQWRFCSGSCLYVVPFIKLFTCFYHSKVWICTTQGGKTYMVHEVDQCCKGKTQEMAKNDDIRLKIDNRTKCVLNRNVSGSF